MLQKDPDAPQIYRLGTTWKL